MTTKLTEGQIARITSTLASLDLNDDLLAVSRGEEPQEETTIFWDRQDPSNEGPAYYWRGESGALEVIGWEKEGRRMTAREVREMMPTLRDWFDGVSGYLGINLDGVNPLFIAA